jgi:hypothetical protein
MACTLEWNEKRTGVVKHFSGEVTVDDVITTEKRIVESSEFTSLRYVISNYLMVSTVKISDGERLAVKALRLGGYYSNPRIKFAFVTTDPVIRRGMENSAKDGHIIHPCKVFENFEAALEWVST